MSALKLTQFRGTAPIRSVRSLPDFAGTVAKNLGTDSGALEPLKLPRHIADLGVGTKKVYRIPLGDLLDLDNSFWWEFDDWNTDVVHAPIVNDSFDRYYFASPSTGIRYNTKTRILASQANYKLGVPAPATGVTLGVTGGSGTTVTRSYVVTWVNIYGEEGQPSPPTEFSGFVNGTWNITSIPQPGSGDVADRPAFDKINLYRTITAQSGVTTFFRVAQLSIGTGSYNDTLSDSIVSGNLQIESTTWAMPPADIEGIAAMPNGIFVGFKGDQLYFSENYRPHAWPVEYTITVQYPIVGLGVYGNTCVVCTEGAPAAVSGVKAAGMNLLQQDLALPCLSRGSIVATEDGVYFASGSGLMLIGPTGLSNVTDRLIGREAWLRDFAPDNLRAISLDGDYIALSCMCVGVQNGFYFNPKTQDTGVINLRFDIDAADTTIMLDHWSGRPLMITNEKVYEVLPYAPDGDDMEAVWRSKEFHLPEPINFVAFQLFWDMPDPAVLEPGRVKIWAGRKLIYDQRFRPSGRIVNLPSGFMSDIWQIEITTNYRVHAFHIATSVAELKGV